MTMRTVLRGRLAEKERGAVLVETALVVPILMLLVSGVLVLGFAWKGKMTVETSSRAGARTASNLGADSLADYNVLQTVLSGLSEIPTSKIQRVVVFKANTSNTVPSACLSGSSGVSNICNVYTSSSYALNSSNFGSCTSGPDRYWCPANRITAQSASNGPDYVGVYVLIDPPFVANMYGISAPPVSSTTIMRLEPS